MQNKYSADANILALHVNIQATFSFSDLLCVWYT